MLSQQRASVRICNPPKNQLQPIDQVEKGCQIGPHWLFQGPLCTQLYHQNPNRTQKSSATRLANLVAGCSGYKPEGDDDERSLVLVERSRAQLKVLRGSAKWKNRHQELLITCVRQDKQEWGRPANSVSLGIVAIPNYAPGSAIFHAQKFQSAEKKEQ